MIFFLTNVCVCVCFFFFLTNVAKTQDVLLDSTIFFGNTGQKDRTTLMNKNIPKELS